MCGGVVGKIQKRMHKVALNMPGRYLLDASTVDEIVMKKSAGNFALGYMQYASFIVRYIGRSDSDVKEEIKKHIGKGYCYFKFSYAASPKEAFEKECLNYHDFNDHEGRLDNEKHPTRPVYSNRTCSVCKKLY